MSDSRRPKSLGEVGELAFLDELLPELASGTGVEVGPGDDCAVVRAGGKRWLLTTDTQVEGVHFETGWMSWRQLGRKSYLINASDAAAMGGRPLYCLSSAAAPPRFAARDLLEIHRGMTEAAGENGAAVVGGNLTGAAQLLISVTLVAEAPPKPLCRSGAKPGDGLYVTGGLGEAALGLRRLHEKPTARGAAVRRFCEPQPRLEAGAVLARRGVASAAIDISDGLLQDLGHLCRASRVGAEIAVDALPMSPQVRRAGRQLALCGGEDYELLCAIPEKKAKSLADLGDELGCALTRVGRCLAAGRGVRVIDERGNPIVVDVGGFDHFAGGRV